MLRNTASRKVPSRVILDNNILLILAYGEVDRESRGSKRRVHEYMPADFEMAAGLVGRFRQAVVTPNVVTECSGLFSDEADAREKAWLKAFLSAEDAIRVEEYVPSRDAAGLAQYEYLGIADCSLLSLIDDDTVLLTTDARLYYAGAKINPLCMNFHHFRNFT
jgi:hypothetical protein